MSSKPVVLIAEELSPATVDALGPDFEIRHCNGADRAELLPAIADVDAILIRSATKVDAEAIAAANRLKVVARAGVGLDNVDVSAATKAGVMVVNAPTSNIVSAAELAIGHILSLARLIPAANNSLKAGEWARSRFTGAELYEKTVGIVGLGRIGTAIAERCEAFGCAIAWHGPRSKEGVSWPLYADPRELAEWADVLVAACPGGAATRGIISREVIEALGPKGVFVNIARGSVVDEPALVEALVAGRLGGAGLDVFADEPRVPEALFALDSVVLAPHAASGTHETRAAMGQLVLENVAAWFAGRPLLTPVV